jgi:tetratricopeptide (TPR) repeat protein
MSVEAFAALLNALAASLGEQPAALDLRRQIAALGDASASAAAATRCCRMLVEAGRLDDAHRLYAALAEALPEQPAGPLGLARIANRRGNWAEAVALWDDCMRRFPQQVQPDWTYARARAAERVAAGATVATPRPPQPRPVTVPVTFHGADPFATAAGTVQALVRADRMRDARKEYATAFAAATEMAHFRTLYMTLGPLFDDWERTSALLQLRATLAARAPAFTPDRQREAAGVQLRICLSLRDYRAFLDGFAALTADGPLPDDDKVLERIAAKVGHRGFPNFGAEKVFGIGLSKTGTTSFVAALEILGYSALHWTNPATHELFADDDVFLFDAFADLPTCEHFEQFYYTYANAKFIYTTRPFESWKRSYLAQMHAQGDASFAARRTRAMRGTGVTWGNRHARLAFGLYYNYSSIEEAFESYDRRVRRFFADKPAARFLEFSLSDGHGWPELCGFLRKPVPTLPYPRKNPQKAAGAA